MVILGNYEQIEEGQEVKRTGRILSVPVGDAFLGRVVDPLGQPLDGLGDIAADQTRALELQAASVVQRQPVSEPLQTGITAIDAMTPIGRGQRQLIIGDRKTGKTAVCVDTILNQRANWESGDPQKQVRCIYVAVGQKAPRSPRCARRSRTRRLDYTTIVAAPRRTPRLQVARPVDRPRSASTACTRASTSDRVRRPDQAGRGVPRTIAAAASSAGPRGVPRRRLLLALPSARALREAERRARRRFADGPSGHRDQGERHLGVHPDERHLDHRRAVLLPVGPVQLGSAPRGRRDHLGVPRRWFRAGPGATGPSAAASPVRR